MRFELSLVIVALLFALYLYVWSNPKQEIEEPVKVIDRSWTVKDRTEGGYFILVEVL